MEASNKRELPSMQSPGHNVGNAESKIFSISKSITPKVASSKMRFSNRENRIWMVNSSDERDD